MNAEVKVEKIKVRIKARGYYGGQIRDPGMDDFYLDDEKDFSKFWMYALDEGGNVLPEEEQDDAYTRAKVAQERFIAEKSEKKKKAKVERDEKARAAHKRAGEVSLKAKQEHAKKAAREAEEAARKAQEAANAAEAEEAARKAQEVPFNPPVQPGALVDPAASSNVPEGSASDLIG